MVSVYFLEPVASSFSGLIAVEPGPRTACLARRPDGHELQGGCKEDFGIKLDGATCEWFIDRHGAKAE